MVYILEASEYTKARSEAGENVKDAIFFRFNLSTSQAVRYEFGPKVSFLLCDWLEQRRQKRSIWYFIVYFFLFSSYFT